MTTPKPKRFTGRRRLLAGVTAGVLSVITGVISYQHGLFVVELVGNHGLVAYLVPLVPDLMIVTSSLTLIEASAMKAKRPFMSVVALLAGIGWTVAMNVAAGVPNGPGDALINAGVPLAFVLTFESMLWLFRRGRGCAGDTAAPATASQGEPPTTEEALALLLATDSERGLAAALRVDRSKVTAWKRKLAGLAETGVPEPALNGSGPHD